MGTRDAAAMERMFGKGKATKDYNDKVNPTPVEIGATTAGPLVKPEARTDYKPPAPPKPVVPPPNANPTGFAQPTSAEDMITPGVGQQAFDWYGGEFFEPTTGQGLWGNIGGDFQKPGASERIGGDLAENLASRGTQGDTYGVDYWQGIQGQTADPRMIDEAWSNIKGVENDIDSYYDNAFTSAQRKLNRSQAARGRFDSTDAIRAAGEQANQFEGARAKDESTFRMERAKAMNDLAVQGTNAKRDWLMGMGDIAFKAGDEERQYADTASVIADRAQNAEINRMQSAFNAAFGVDNASTSRLSTGFEAAFGAQEARDNRAFKGTELDILLGDKAAGVYGKEGEGEGELVGSALGTGMAAAADKQRAQEAEAQASQQAYLDALALTGEAMAKSRGGPGPSAPGSNVTSNPGRLWGGAGPSAKPP
jgi:hypothetical protein